MLKKIVKILIKVIKKLRERYFINEDIISERLEFLLKEHLKIVLNYLKSKQGY